MSEDPKLEAIIALLYESVLDPKLLKEALGLCAIYAGADEAMVVTYDKMTQLQIGALVAGSRFAPNGFDDYMNHYWKIDPRKHVNLGKIREWRCCTDFNDQKFVSKNEFYQDFLIPNEVRYIMGARLCSDDNEFIVNGFIRAIDREPFDINNISAANSFFDHLQRTLRLHKQTQTLQTKIDLGAIAIDNLPISMIITNHKGQIEHLNSKAEKTLITSNSGLHSVMGNLVATKPVDRHKLSNLISNAAITNGRGGQMLLNSESPKYIFVTPITPKSTIANNWQIPLALIIINESDNVRSQLEFFKSLYHFTPAELRLAQALLNGISVDKYAQEMGVTINTIRTQLSALFKKTNTSRQGELIALLKSNPSFY